MSLDESPVLSSEVAQPRQQLALCPVDERPLLVATYLYQRDVGEAGVHERLDLLDELVHVAAARHLLGDVLGADVLRRAVEAAGPRQLGVDLPAAAEPAELLVRPLRRLVAVGVVRHRDLTDAWFALAAGGIEELAELLVRLDGDHHVGEPAGEVARLLARDGDTDRRRLVGQVPQPRRLDLEMLAADVDVAAGEQRTDDLDGFLESLVTDVRRGPALSDDVLVEVLAGAEAEGEPALAQQLHRGGLLGDDGRVVAEGRAGDVGHQRDPRRRPRGGAEHRPRIGRVALLVEPWEVVVGDDGEVEAGGLGGDHVVDQLARAGLLAHHRVAPLGHGSSSALRVVVLVPLRVPAAAAPELCAVIQTWRTESVRLRARSRGGGSGLDVRGIRTYVRHAPRPALPPWGSGRQCRAGRAKRSASSPGCPAPLGRQHARVSGSTLRRPDRGRAP